jgi:hypothetical protein
MGLRLFTNLVAALPDWQPAVPSMEFSNYALGNFGNMLTCFANGNSQTLG